MIEQQFGEQEVCFRTLDLYTSAVLEASLSPAPRPKKEYRDVMAKMSEVSTCKLTSSQVSYFHTAGTLRCLFDVKEQLPNMQGYVMTIYMAKHRGLNSDTCAAR